MRRLLQIVYALIVIAVTVIAARTYFGARTAAVTSSIAQTLTAGAAVVHAGPVDTTRPPDAGRFTERPEPEQLLADDSLTTTVFAQLAARYQPALAELKRAVAGAGARLVLVSFGTEGGKRETPLERRTRPIIADACKALGIPYYEFASAMDSAAAEGIQVTIDPKDIHVSKAGAVVVAEQLAAIIAANDSVRSSVHFNDAERPATFGDFTPQQNGVINIGSRRPYLIQTNSQGLRMNYDLRFPKTKQRVMLMGSSLAYFPFLDTDQTGTAVLQAKLPNKEILNAAMLAYSIHDETDLFVAKAQYAEPDLVIVQQNGMDVIRMFFTHANWQDRARRYHAPSAAERAWYLAHYPAK